MGVAIVPLDDPALAMAELDFVLETKRKRSGCRIGRAAAAPPVTSTSTLSGPGSPTAERRSCCM